MVHARRRRTRQITTSGRCRSARYICSPGCSCCSWQCSVVSASCLWPTWPYHDLRDPWPSYPIRPTTQMTPDLSYPWPNWPRTTHLTCDRVWPTRSTWPIWLLTIDPRDPIMTHVTYMTRDPHDPGWPIWPMTRTTHAIHMTHPTSDPWSTWPMTRDDPHYPWPTWPHHDLRDLSDPWWPGSLRHDVVCRLVSASRLWTTWPIIMTYLTHDPRDPHCPWPTWPRVVSASLLCHISRCASLPYTSSCCPSGQTPRNITSSARLITDAANNNNNNNKFGSVRPSVCYFHAGFWAAWPFDVNFASVWVTTIARPGFKVRIIGRWLGSATMITRSVCARSSM